MRKQITNIFKLPLSLKMRELRKVAKTYNIESNLSEIRYKRIYHIHIRKTGGSTLNWLILQNLLNVDEQERKKIWHEIATSRCKFYEKDRYILVGWNRPLLNKEAYFYGWSHEPFEDLKISGDTFSFTVFRDPVARLISHYLQIKSYSENLKGHPGIRDKVKWLGNDGSFKSFLDNAPLEGLCHQLHMFSKNLSVAEALRNVKKVNLVLRQEELNKSGFARFNEALPIFSLKPAHYRKSESQFVLSKSDEDQAKKSLEKEIEFLGNLKDRGY